MNNFMDNFLALDTIKVKMKHEKTTLILDKVLEIGNLKAKEKREKYN